MEYAKNRTDGMKYTLITGGSSGIGRSTAIHLAQLGHHLLLVSNEEIPLQETKTEIEKQYPTVQVKTFNIDLTKENAAEKVLAFSESSDIVVDVLINNAGYGTYGYYDEIDTDIESNMIQLNVLTLHKLTRLFLAKMTKRNQGRIINIASIAAFQPVPRLAAYSATKSFVLSYSRALNYELKMKNSKVMVTSICPPPVKTNFAKTAKMEKSKLFDSWLTVTAVDVATTIVQSLDSTSDMLIPKRAIHHLNKITRRLPTSWLLKYSAHQTS